MLVFLGKLWELVKPYRVRLFLGVLTGILSGLVAPLMITTVMFVYGAVFPASDAVQLPIRGLPRFAEEWFQNVRAALESGLHTHPWAIAGLIAAIPAITFLRGLFSYLNVYFLQWTASRAIADLRTKLFNHLLNLSAGFFSENSTGQLNSRVINDTGALQNIFSGTTAIIVRDPITLLGMMGLLLWQQPKLTLIALIAMPACIIPIAIYSSKVRRASREMQSRSADLTQIMTESFTGHRIVKAYNLERIAAEEFNETARNSVGHFMRLVRAAEIPGALIEFFGACGVALLLTYLIYFSSARPSPTDFLQLVGTILLMYQPMKNLTRMQSQFVQAHAAGERVFEMLALKNSVAEPLQPRRLKAVGADIHFDRIDFAYGDKAVVQGIDLHIQPGQLVALVGQSGSGKTTLANLLLRFYDPQAGAVRIGGVDIREFATRDLRNQMAVVTQENILFNDTIRRNIELGRPGATGDEIIAAARHAHAHEFIIQKPHGYEAIVGEKGVLLSGGQRQRLAIARAVLRNAPILILDEATSAMDTESERAVQAALDELMRDKTTLCIAHRLSTIHHADLIVVLDQGRIVETGRHEELIQRGGIYRKLYEMQFQNSSDAKPPDAS